MKRKYPMLRYGGYLITVWSDDTGYTAKITHRGSIVAITDPQPDAAGAIAEAIRIVSRIAASIMA